MRASSLSDFARAAAKTGDLARISPFFRQLYSHSILKAVKILTQTAILSLTRSKSDRLLGFWNFTQTFALLTLAGRNQDVRAQLPRVIGMLEADDQLTRVYGWDALRLVFENEAKAIGDYDPRASTEACRLKVAYLRQTMAGRC